MIDGATLRSGVRGATVWRPEGVRRRLVGWTVALRREWVFGTRAQQPRVQSARSERRI